MGRDIDLGDYQSAGLRCKELLLEPTLRQPLPQDCWLNTESWEGMHCLLLQGFAYVIASCCHQGHQNGKPHASTGTDVQVIRHLLRPATPVSNDSHLMDLLKKVVKHPLE